MKTIIVTGAAGFLGSHIVQRHLSRGDAVLGIDDFSSSKRSSRHLNALCVNRDFSFREGDITSEQTLDLCRSWAWAKGGVDRIYNFACPASPPIYQAAPIHTMMTCVVGLNNVLRLAKESNSTVIHASTSEVYGDPDRSPQHESYRGNVNSFGPRSCYDEGKRAAEALCFDYMHKYKVDVRLVRIFNTYGPHMDPSDGRVVSNFIVQALRGQKLTIYGDGSQTRSFCYVDDLVDGIVAMGDLGNPGEPINLGNPYEFTIRELAARVIHEVRQEPVPDSQAWLRDIVNDVETLPFPIDDPLQRRPDISKARALLHWTPKVNLQQGLAKTIEYFKENMK